MRRAKQRRRSYRKSLEKHGYGPKALQWRSQEAANLRYENLVENIDFEGKSVLDVGCGFGDISEYIKKRAENFEYTGIDIVPEFIEEARRRHPCQRFIVGDWVRKISRQDIILCSGVLNNKVEGDQYKYREKAIELMYKNAGEVLAFNMAGGHPQPENKKKYKVYYVDSLRVLKYCLSLTSRVIFRHHYRRRDFTIIMYR